MNFALFSAHAEKVELCLFDSSGRREVDRIQLPEHTDQIWHGYVSEARPGLLYGYRVYGPYDPARGHRFNHHKLLIDPYARSLFGSLQWSDALFGYRVGHSRGDLSFDRRDSARGVPKCMVVDSAFTWSGDRPLRLPPQEAIIYEMHVRGFTMRHPEVAEPLRGTFAGLSSPAVLDYLARLGVTAVQLLPAQAFIDDRILVRKGLRNYWGYNSINYFAPEPRYLATGLISEFKILVKRLHDRGIEVLLDVVYNHTAEGNHLGPTLSFRGIDNLSYYRLLPDDKRHYEDVTGTGNTVNLSEPKVLRMVLDSLRYWVEEMHVDGFRFDLASALGRDRAGRFQPDSGFFQALLQDPVLSRSRLIAEPWDLGADGYRVGGFLPGWAEWNDKYRDSIRAYWKGEGGLIGELAYRLTGSSDLFEHAGRRPHASINYVTCHDGFTLQDLVSYERRHNEANGEHNADGHPHNISSNYGHEGPTTDPAINALRRRQKRNFLAVLLLSQGVPMLLAGDEIGRSQGGNNNAYCQDNETSWLDWEAALREENLSLLHFVRKLVALRRRNPVFRRNRFFQGRQIPGSRAKDIAWLTPRGGEMDQHEWDLGHARCLGALLGPIPAEEDPSGDGDREPKHFMVLLNAGETDLHFILPAGTETGSWQVVFDTARPEEDEAPLPRSRRSYPLQGRSLVLLSGMGIV